MRRFLQIFLLLLLLTVGGGSWYLYKKGLTKPWRESIVDEVRKHGVEMSFGKLTVEPFRGLVAKDVKIFDSPKRKRVIAKVDEIVIEANYASAARGQNFLDALTLVDASLELPLDQRQPDGPSVKIEQLNTRVLLPPGQLLVSRLDALVFGIRVQASGQFASPEVLTSRKTADERKADPAILHLVKELRGMHYEGATPRLDIRFSGDLAQPETLLVEAELHAEKVRRDGYRLEKLDVAGNWQNGALVVSRFDARDKVGRLQLSANYDSTLRTAQLRMLSGMDLPGFVKALHILDLGDFEFQSVPQLDLTAKVKLSPPKSTMPPQFQVFGQVRIGPFSYGKMPFDRLSADVAFDGKRWALREFQLVPQEKKDQLLLVWVLTRLNVQQGILTTNQYNYLFSLSGGGLRADIQQDYDEKGAGDFRLGLTSTLNPEVFIAALKLNDLEAAARLAMCKFYDAPKITLSARGPSPLDSAASGELVLGRTSYRGAEAKSARGNLRYAGRVLNVDDFVVQRSEGVGGGGLAFDLNTKTVQIKQVRTSLHPLDMALWIDPDLVNDIRPYRFQKKPPQLLIDGIVDQVHGGTRTRLNVNLDATAMDYTFCGKDLHLTDVTGKLFFNDARLKIDSARVGLFGGNIKGDADISLLKAKPGHVATMRFTDVDFTSLTKLYFGYDESKGKLNGTYNFNGRGDEGRSMKGEGELTVTEGNVFAIPFLGPFSDILGKIVPGIGYNSARKASMTFAISDGIITTKNLAIEGRGFSMFGNGRIWFLDDRMDFDMRINMQGLPALVFFPVSKLLEYRADSKFSKPEWRPKVIPNLGGTR